jgi:hypothetical protein
MGQKKTPTQQITVTVDTIKELYAVLKAAFMYGQPVKEVILPLDDYENMFTLAKHAGLRAHPAIFEDNKLTFNISTPYGSVSISTKA